MLCLSFFSLSAAFAQTKTVTGKVTDSKDGSAVSGVSVTVKGTKTGTTTAKDGTFKLNVPDNAQTLIFSSVGYGTSDVAITGSSVNATLTPSNDQIGEVVVVGYGSVRRKDLTGSVASVKAKDFNKGIQNSPDQLIQGKVAGVQVIQNSGAPGAGTTIRIRGASSIRAGNGPLFVVDGVPLAGNNTRPNVDVAADIGGSTPEGNPLNFINPADIASMEVLKDASAAAIYGSRGANGVVIITTKRAQSGQAKVDVNMSVGTSSILKRLKVLDGNQYRTALGEFGFPTTVNTSAVPTANFGGNVDALGSILQNGTTQNYGVALSAGTDNAKYRLSFSYLDQQGIIRKTGFKKYTVGFNSSFKMLDNKKLTLDVSVLTSHTSEQVAPISNTAGFKGSLIGQALQWNPTKALRNPDGSLNIEYGSTDINPLAFSEAYFDNPKVTTVLASIAPSYKFNDKLEYKLQYAVNYGSGVRKAYTTAYININEIALSGGKGGAANVAQNELVTTTITNTLSYNNKIGKDLNVSAVVGHEYIKTNFSGNSDFARGFIPTEAPYYYFMASSDPTTRRMAGFADPQVELQSYFARGIFNLQDKYLLTATVRADGSSKFGSDNRYGVFPALAAAWNVSKEGFLKDFKAVENVKLRLGWGVTGNQEFPAGASRLLYTLSGGNPATFQQSQIPNPALKWETTTTTNIGLDFTVAKGRVNVGIEYFERKTKDILFPREAADPVTPNSAVKWVNLPGAIINNSGLELNIGASLVKTKDWNVDVNLNATFLKNRISNFALELPTGEVNGQGLSGAYAQLLKNDQPLNAFYLKDFIGIDKTTGISLYRNGEEKFFLGSPNPTTLLGFTTSVGYKKFSLELAFNGSMGQMVYNNTANAILALNNLGKRNIGLSEYNTAKSLGEKPVNPTSASSRYLEKGDYLRLANATLSYQLGNIGNVIKNANIYITAQNLFIITNFSGFDPEVNVSKPLNGVPSFGMEYTPYPSARFVNFGINFSL